MGVVTLEIFQMQMTRPARRTQDRMPGMLLGFLGIEMENLATKLDLPRGARTHPRARRPDLPDQPSPEMPAKMPPKHKSRGQSVFDCSARRCEQLHGDDCHGRRQLQMSARAEKEGTSVERNGQSSPTATTALCIVSQDQVILMS